MDCSGVSDDVHTYELGMRPRDGNEAFMTGLETREIGEMGV